MSEEKRNASKQKYQSGIVPQAQFNWMYGILMAVSGVLASIAFRVDSIPMLIGSMVIAPVMPPLVLISIGLSNTNVKLILNGLWIATAGLVIALLTSVTTTWFLSILGINQPNLELSKMLLERVTPGWYSLFAAISAGVAGALAISHKRQDTIVGVVASIALVPTIAGVGIAAMLAEWQKVWDGIAMLGINVGAIVFVGWIVFNLFSESGD